MMALGFFPYFVDDTGLLASNITTPLDFYGVHFDVVFPDVPSVEITGSQFRMAANGGVFGVGPVRAGFRRTSSLASPMPAIH
ncbi:MAG: hypothetical protein WCC08_06465 [Terrimicrobiaceae bacterium]